MLITLIDANYFDLSVYIIHIYILKHHNAPYMCVCVHARAHTRLTWLIKIK